jgi:hypothetical protein
MVEALIQGRSMVLEESDEGYVESYETPFKGI